MSTIVLCKHDQSTFNLYLAKTMKNLNTLIATCFLLLATSAAHAEKITVAAAADLKFAMDEIVTAFKKTSPTDEIEIIYGLSSFILHF